MVIRECCKFRGIEKEKSKLKNEVVYDLTHLRKREKEAGESHKNTPDEVATSLAPNVLLRKFPLNRFYNLNARTKIQDAVLYGGLPEVSNRNS